MKTIEEAIKPFLEFADSPTFKHLQPDFVLTPGSSMARRQLTARDFWELQNAVNKKEDPVINAVREDLHRRSQFGIKKYGTTLAENNAALRDRLQHAYEECLDMANYLKWSIMLLDDNLISSLGGDAETEALVERHAVGFNGVPITIGDECTWLNTTENRVVFVKLHSITENGDPVIINTNMDEHTLIDGWKHLRKCEPPPTKAVSMREAEAQHKLHQIPKEGIWIDGPYTWEDGTKYLTGQNPSSKR